MKKAVKEQQEKAFDVAEQVHDTEQLTKFNVELKALLGKYGLGLVAVPKLVPMQNGAFAVAGEVQAVKVPDKTKLAEA